MKLHYSAASPFVRKVMVTAIECGLRDKLTLVAVNPHQSPPELVAANPFSKVPALELDDGDIVFESLLICEYLDHLAGGGIVFPVDWASRFAMLRRHGFGNGLMEVAVLRRMETVRAKEGDREKNLARQASITARVLDRLDADASSFGDTVDLGNISIAIALDYLDFRFPGDRWREGRAALASWHERYSARDSLKATVPQDAK